MKKVLIVLAIFGLSTSVFAREVAGTFELFLGGAASPSESFTFAEDGKVTGVNLIGNCSGTYSLKWNGYLSVTYDGMQGPGTGGGCHNSSSTIDVGEADLRNMNNGDEVFVISRSIMFFNAPKNGVLKKVN